MKFNVTDDSGTTLTLEGDSPPTEQELNDIFSTYKAPTPVPPRTSTLEQLPSALFGASDETQQRSAEEVAAASAPGGVQTPEGRQALRDIQQRYRAIQEAVSTPEAAELAARRKAKELQDIGVESVDLGEPVSLPKLSTEEQRTLFGSGRGGAAAGAAQRAVTGIAEGFLSPEGTGMFVPGVKPIVATAFMAQMIKSVPEQASQALGYYSAGDTASGDEALINAAVTAGMLTVPHALSKRPTTLEDAFGKDNAKAIRDTIQQAQQPRVPSTAGIPLEPRPIYFPRQTTRRVRLPEPIPVVEPTEERITDATQERPEISQVEPARTEARTDIPPYQPEIRQAPSAETNARHRIEGGGVVPTETPPSTPPTPNVRRELITSAAFTDDNGVVHTGANHPEILARLGIKGFETPESRNTPQFGYATNLRPFVTRPEAVPIIEKSGQKLTDFEFPNQPHSNEVRSPVEPEKPISEVQQQPTSTGEAKVQIPETPAPTVVTGEKGSTGVSKGSVSGEGAVEKVQTEVQSVARSEGQRPAKEVKSESVLKSEPQVRITVPEGSTQLRVTDTEGRKSVQPISELKKGNTFQGVDVVKIEAGTIDRSGKFRPIEGEVKVEPSTRTLQSRAGSETVGGLSEDAINNHLRTKYGLEPGSKVVVLTEPDQAHKGQAVFLDWHRPGEAPPLLRIELNAAHLRNTAEVDDVLEHEIAHGATSIGEFNDIARKMTVAERDAVFNEIEKLGYPVEEAYYEFQARGTKLLADAWRNRSWFEKAVGVILRFANELGFKMTRLAAESTAARAIQIALARESKGQAIYLGSQERTVASRVPDEPPLEPPSELSPDDEKVYHQVAGVPGIGTAYAPGKIVLAQKVIQERFNPRQEITPESTKQFWQELELFTDPTTRREAAQSMWDTVNKVVGGEKGANTADLAPALHKANLTTFAERLAARGDIGPLSELVRLSDEWLINPGGLVGDAARALRGLGEVTPLLKSLSDSAKGRLEALGSRLGVGRELFKQLMDELELARRAVGAEFIEQAVRDGKDARGRTIQDILNAVDEQIFLRDLPKRKARLAQLLDFDAERAAARALERLQLKHGAEWLKPNLPKNPILQLLKNYLKSDQPLSSMANAFGEVKETARQLQELGVGPQVALDLAWEAYEERRTNWTNKRFRQMETAANSRNVRVLIDEVLANPLRSRSDPVWRREAAINWFLERGLSRDQAEAAATRFSSEFDRALSLAEERAAQQVLQKSKPRTVSDVLQAIRASALDPSKPWFDKYAEKLGIKSITPAELSKLAELDQKLAQGLPSLNEQVMVENQMFAILRRQKLPPTIMETIASNFIVSPITALRTHTIHIFAPMVHMFEERVLATLSNWPTATNLRTLWQPLAQAARRWFSEYRFGLGSGMSLFPVTEMEGMENKLRQLWESGTDDLQSKDWKRKGIGLGKMLAGVQDFNMRLLNAANQANVVMMREGQLALYGSEAFREFGLNPARINVLVEAMSGVKRQAYEEAINRGLTENQAKAAANSISAEWLREMIGKETSHEASRKAWKAAENDALSAVGRLGKGISEKEEGGIVSRYLGLHWMLRLAGQLRRESPQSKIGGLYLLGYVAVPVRMARFLAWNSYYGLVRLGIDKFRKSKGWDTWWKQSLGNAYQEQNRLRLAIAASVVQTLLLAGAGYLGKKTSADDDTKNGWFVTGLGPKNREVRDAWSKQGFQPQSLIFMVNGHPIAIPLTRAGESLGHLLWPFAAMDDHAWAKKEALATGKPLKDRPIAEMASALGSYAEIIGQRGPVMQILQTRRGGGSAETALAAAAGHLAGPVVPFSGLQRSIRDLIIGPVDQNTPEAAFWSNFPILGAVTGQGQSLNRFGDPLYDHSWYAKMARTGVPIAVRVSNNQPNAQLYAMIAEKGAGPPQLRRSVLEEKYGPMTDEEFTRFTQLSGEKLKATALANLPGLETMKPEDVKKFLSRAATDADNSTAAQMDKQRLKPSRESADTGAAPSSLRGFVGEAGSSAPGGRTRGLSGSSRGVTGGRGSGGLKAPSLRAGRRVRLPGSRLVKGRLRARTGRRVRLGTRRPRAAKPFWADKSQRAYRNLLRQFA